MGLLAWETRVIDRARLEIWFPSPEEVSVFIETPASNAQAREVIESSLFAAYAARQLVNLRKGVSSEMLASTLASLEHPESDDDIPEQLGDTRIVAPSPRRGRKGFEATVALKDGIPLITLHPRGFGMLGRGVDFYAPTSTLALYLHLLRRMSPEGRFVLVETAKTVGSFAITGKLALTSQAQVAGAAVADAVAKLETSDAVFARSDDPAEDYALLLAHTQEILSQVVESLAGGEDERVIVPEWLAWRVCHEATLAHYEEYSGGAYEMRQRAGDREGEYDRYLEQLAAEAGLSEIVQQLHSDCFSSD